MKKPPVLFGDNIECKRLRRQHRTNKGVNTPLGTPFTPEYENEMEIENIVVANMSRSLPPNPKECFRPPSPPHLIYESHLVEKNIKHEKKLKERQKLVADVGMNRIKKELKNNERRITRVKLGTPYSQVLQEEADAATEEREREFSRQDYEDYNVIKIVPFTQQELRNAIKTKQHRKSYGNDYDSESSDDDDQGGPCSRSTYFLQRDNTLERRSAYNAEASKYIFPILLIKPFIISTANTRDKNGRISKRAGKQNPGHRPAAWGHLPSHDGAVESYVTNGP